MRRVLALLLLLAVDTIATAAGPAIEWSSQRRLVWEDFRGPVPAGATDERVAATAASLSWSNEYSIAWSRDTCSFSIARIDSAALFHPETSWVRPGHRTPDVLEHEQGHFDIAQIFHHQFELETARLVGASRECRGRNQRAASRFAEREVGELIGTIYDEVWRQYRAEQEAYDHETRHGIDAAAQAAWTREIAARLETAQK